MPDIKKIIKYEKEQLDILNNILNILNFNNNYSFTLNELDNNEEIKTSIMSYLNDVKKYYPSSNCTAVTNKNCKRPYMSLIKYILKFHNKKMYSSEICLPQEDKKYLKTVKYEII